MADWEADWGSNGQSRRSSSSSGRSGEVVYDNGRRGRGDGLKYQGSIGSASTCSEKSLIRLADGNQLSEESITDQKNHGTNGITTNGSTLGSAPRLPPKDVNRMKKPAPSIPTITTPASVDTIPEEDITIPTEGCLYNFTADEMATFFRYMRIEDRLINHWQRRGLDGKKFSKLSNTELDSCGVNNPIMRFFRDKSAKKTNKGRMNFLL